MTSLRDVTTAVREAGTKIRTAASGIARADDKTAWLHRFIAGELGQRARTRGPGYWDELYPGLSREERARRRIRRMLTRATIAGACAASGATAAELASIATEGALAPVAIPLGLLSVGGEMLYTSALEIDLAFDLAAIYGVPLDGDDVGEVSTLLALALGVDLASEPTRHDRPAAAAAGATKPWRVVRQMGRADFAREIGRELVSQSVLRNVVPIAGVVVSGVWNQIVLRRFARAVHAAVRARRALVDACRDVRLGRRDAARTILDGAWLVATADGDVDHAEALALSTLIDTLPLPERIAVDEASFPDDEEAWFGRLGGLDETERDVLVDVLVLVAAADGHPSVAERRLLRRVAAALDRRIHDAAIERAAERLRAGASPERAAEPARTQESALQPA